MTAVSPPTIGMVIDITDDPNKAYFEGYHRLYRKLSDGSECSAMHVQSRSGREFIALNEICKDLNITSTKLRADMMQSLDYLRSNGNARSFSHYFQISGYKYFTDEPQQFCLDTQSANYGFLNVPSLQKKGWKNIYRTNMSAARLSSKPVGFWKVDPNGSVIAQTSKGLTQISMSGAYQCGNVPYAPDLLQPAR